MRSETLETRVARIWLEDGLLYVTVKEGARETLEDARAGQETSLRLIGEGNRVPVLVDLTRIRVMTREARTFHASDEQACSVVAMALVVRSPISRVIGNFYLGINRPSYPLRLFNDVEAAVTWLRGYVSRD